MKIAVIGATGKAGRQIVSEAHGRGHHVTGIVRTVQPELTGNLDETIVKNLFDLTKEDLTGFDVVISAYGSPMGKAEEHIPAMKHLISVMEQLPDIRLIVVGGAGSLYADEHRLNLVIDSIPQAWRAVPENMAHAFELLKQSKVKWTYFSPAAQFDPKGKRTGHVVLGQDYKILNPDGKSYISYADYAVAMIDECEKGQFVGKRFTAVSDTSISVSNRMLFDIGSMPFIRHGGYMGIFASNRGFFRGGVNYGAASLYIGSRRGGISQRHTNELIKIAPTYKDKKISYAIHTSPTELILRTAYGEIRCCFAEKGLLYFKGENGLGLALDKDMEIHEIMKKRPGKAWEGVFRWTCSCIFNPLVGDLEMNAPWDWEKLTTPVVHGLVRPDENGNFMLAVDETEHAGFVRDSYPTYEEGLADVTADWESFLATIPEFVRPLDEKREEAAYILWSHIVHAAGKIRRPFMFMTGTTNASSWQMCQNAVALHHNLPLATELLLNMIDEQAPNGQFPDFYNDSWGLFQLTKPPQQGWALKWLMKFHDLKKEIPQDKLERLYTGYAAWANWHMEWRDDDGDGLPQYEHPDESGGDDCTVFKKYAVVDCPDLAAYLGLLFEALGDIALMLDKGQDVADEWYARSKTIIEKMIARYWNGERFVAFAHETGEEIANDNLLYYMPLCLGSRLPKDIVKKMAADLQREGEFLTNYGLATEKLNSDEFSLEGMAQGAIIPPHNLLIITGLYDAGEVQLAKKLAMRYCKSMADAGLAFIINPITGPRGGMFAGSWPACAYIALSDLYSNL